MRFKKLIFATLALVFLSCNVAISGYVINDSLFSAMVQTKEDDSYHTVQFLNTDGSVWKEMRVEDNYILSLKDAPSCYPDGNNATSYYLWYDSKDENTILNNHIVVSDNIQLKFKTIDAPSITQTVSFSENLSKNATEVAEPKHVSIGTPSSSDSTNYEVVYPDYALNVRNNPIKGKITYMTGNAISIFGSNTILSSNYEEGVTNEPTDKALQGINIKYNSGEEISIGDFSIGLENPENTLTGYKPFTGTRSLANTNSSSNFNNGVSNYCVYRFTLNCDVVLLGNFSLGALVGFYGNYWYFSQYCFQGFIIGSYYELDLNGYDFVVANGSLLDAYGSVTDSSRYNSDGTYNDALSDYEKGHLILHSGSTFYTPFVIEDYYRPESIPAEYANGSTVFSMYRTPYVDCDTYIYPGANYYGKVRVDLAGAGSGGLRADFLLFGNESPLISISSKPNSNGYVVRSVSYDNDLIKNKTTYKFFVKNLQHQKITYEFHDLNISFGKIDFTAGISSINFNLTTSRYDFYIPPYFDFYVYNSTVSLNQQLVFMPGTYVYVDKNSILQLGVTARVSYTYANDVSRSVFGSSLFSTYTQTYQQTGGLTFIPMVYPNFGGSSKEATVSSSYMNVMDSFGQDIFIFETNKNFWAYVNSKGSRCDFYGQFSFSNNNNEQFRPIVLAGNINIYNYSGFTTEFTNSINKGIQISLFSRTFLIGPTQKSTSNIRDYLYVSGFYNIPLISNNNVLANIANGTTNEIAQGQIVWDPQTGLFKIGTANVYFAYFYNNTDNSNMAQCDNLNNADSLAGTFERVTFDEATRVITKSDGSKYIYFNGAMVAVDNNLCGTLEKFVGSKCEYNERNTTYKFTASSLKWGLSDYNWQYWTVTAQ